MKVIDIRNKSLTEKNEWYDKVEKIYKSKKGYIDIKKFIMDVEGFKTPDFGKGAITISVEPNILCLITDYESARAYNLKKGRKAPVVVGITNSDKSHIEMSAIEKRDRTEEWIRDLKRSIAQQKENRDYFISKGVPAINIDRIIKTQTEQVTKLERSLENLPARNVMNKNLSDVQSLLFAREKGWKPEKAKEWAKEHGYKYGDVHETERYVRLRQFDPTRARKALVPFGKDTGIKSVMEFRGNRNPDEIGDVWELESQSEKAWSEDLDRLSQLALKGNRFAQNYLKKIFEESWERIKEKLLTEGSVWYVWWMDGVHKYMRMENEKKRMNRNPHLLLLFNSGKTYKSVSLPYFQNGEVSFFDLDGESHKVKESDFRDITTDGGRMRKVYTYLVREKKGDDLKAYHSREGRMLKNAVREMGNGNNKERVINYIKAFEREMLKNEKIKSIKELGEYLRENCPDLYMLYMRVLPLKIEGEKEILKKLKGNPYSFSEVDQKLDKIWEESAGRLDFANRADKQGYGLNSINKYLKYIGEEPLEPVDVML